MIKSKDDFVKVVNVSRDGKNPDGVEFKAGEIIFAHDSIHYTVPKGESIIVRREVAEHGVKKSWSYANKVHGLKIEELPEAQRNSRILTPSDDSKVIEEKDKEIEALKAQLAAAQEPKPEEQPEPEAPAPRGRHKGKR